jgi:dimethylglycine dehydrogenase
MIWGSSAAQKYHMRWFERHLPKDGSVRIHRFDQTLVGLSIAGPKSQALLAELCDEDVSTSAFRFMDVREMAVGGAPCHRQPHLLHRRSRLRDLDAARL